MICVVFGCAAVGGIADEIMYGWIAKLSISGALRPLARYAAPRSRMKAVGECVGRIPSGRSAPRGETAAPITRRLGSTALSAS